ncbi:hypothetical protein MKW94_003287 [Papaver nudicaule]|uniref:TF-B3 domain-containing protein n=1 Tax=Papaver nudicaule TaxID=74823 RepID=A0AA41SIG9_PAPNU|nr:hypothetical protein [Papaver nudicaule]
MVMSKSPYEDLRLKRLEENKKRIDDLKLNHLATNFKNSSSKSSQVKQSKPRVLIQKKLEFVQVRRSNRLSDKPAPVYEEVFVHEYARRRTVNGFSKGRAVSLGDFPIASEIDRANATNKAVNVETSIGDDGFPCFVKPMLHSHVNRGFWLGLPAYFCRDHLPKRDETITLVDELGEEFPTNYLAQKNGLSGGWKGFAEAHDLIDGDALVFQLVEPTKFKIHIIRANGSPNERHGEESS